MKWNTTRLNQPFTWYSADVIKKIKKIALETCLTCGECQTEFSQKSDCEINEILEIITNEDKES